MAKKLTVDQLDEMRKLLGGGMAGSDVARQIGCSDRAVYERRQMWRMKLEKTRSKTKKPKPKSGARIPQYEHGHHFDPQLRCMHCGFKHPDTGKWTQDNWTRCPAAEPLEEISEVVVPVIEPRTHCKKRGHELTPENIYTPPSGRSLRQCRACRAIRSDLRHEREAAKKRAAEREGK